MIETTAQPKFGKVDLKPTMADGVVALLSRVTSSGMFIPEIDGMRFFAIAGVLVAHIAYLVASQSLYSNTAKHTMLYAILSTGAYGVRLFFSISGFILCLPFADHYINGKSCPSLQRYYTRRVTRLEPPYIICLIVGFIGICVCGSNFHAQILHFFASIIYMHGLIYHHPSTIGGILWSLEVEVQFYILAPFLANVFRITGARLRRSIIGNLHFFLIGFLVADVYLVKWKHEIKKSLSWDFLMITSISLLFLVNFYGFAIWYYAFPIIVYLSYKAAFQGVLMNSIVRNRWLVITGGMCYTTYLYHMIIIRALWQMVTSHLLITHVYWIDYMVQLSILCPVILGVGSILFVLFEKPFMKRDWPSKWRSVFQSVLSRSSV